MKKLFLFFILLFLLAGFLLPAAEVQAGPKTYLMQGVSPTCWTEGGTGTGDCSFCDVLRVIYNVGKLVFGAMAGVAMILFLWAGTGLIFNMGNPEVIARNKKLILHTLIAIVIILTAYTLVNLSLHVLTGKALNQPVKLDSRVWTQGPKCN